MAAAFLDRLADPARVVARSAGTRPAVHVHPEVVTVMREIGIDLGTVTPRALTPDLAKDAGWLVTMGCGDECPFIPGAIVEDWPFDDPHGRPLEEVRRIRDQIAARVTDFLRSKNWLRDESKVLDSPT
jgi:arsenate reductase